MVTNIKINMLLIEYKQGNQIVTLHTDGLKFGTYMKGKQHNG